MPRDASKDSQASPQQTQPGQLAATTVVQLQPVSYRMTVSYLGPARIKHGSRHRCFHELEMNGVRLPGGPVVMPNVVKGPTGIETGVFGGTLSAATPAADGGGPENPINDVIYRTIIRDIHGVRVNDINLFYGDGDKVSRPKNYKNNNWERDVTPAIALRVVIRRFVGIAPDDMPQEFKLTVEVKDPAEERGGGPDIQAEFNQAFFKRHNRTGSDPSPGDDNAQQEFSGVRESAAGAPAGARASKVLSVAPYAKFPVADEFSFTDSPAQVVFDSLKPAPEFKRTLTQLSIETQPDTATTGVKVGIVDIVLLPPPVGGDNYRLLFTLGDAGGADVRGVTENGSLCTLLDETLLPIPQPRAYCTGRFVLLRRVPIELVIICNNLDPSVLDFAAVNDQYKRAFVEVPSPPSERFVTIRRETWRDELRRRFAAKVRPAILKDEATFSQTVFETRFLPIPLLPRPDGARIDPEARRLDPTLPERQFSNRQREDLTNDAEAICERLIKLACKDAGIPDPTTDTLQANNRGMIILACQNFRPTDFAGVYLGDRRFALENNIENPANITGTFVHELGHALSLRHYHISSEQAIDLDSNKLDFTMFPTNGDTFVFDHDSHDFGCVMAGVLRTSGTRLCGMCEMTLRHYNRVKIQSKAQYRSVIAEDYQGGQIIAATPPDPRAGAGVWRFLAPQTGDIFPIGVGKTRNFIAVGPAHTFTDFGESSPHDERLNLNGIPGSVWSASPSGFVQIQPGKKSTLVRGLKAGNVTLRYANPDLGIDLSRLLEIQ